MVKKIGFLLALIGIIGFSPVDASGNLAKTDMKKESDDSLKLSSSAHAPKITTETLPDGSIKTTTYVFVPELNTHVKAAEFTQKQSQTVTQNTTITTSHTKK